VAAAEELHFGRSAQRLEMLLSALGRFIRLVEEDLGTRLMMRTTRSVTLTDDGTALLKEARTLLAPADALAAKYRTHGRKQAATVRVGAIDSAAAGLLAKLLHDFLKQRPDVTFNWSKIRRSGCCRAFCPAGLTSLSCALRNIRTSC